jgi:hypothetical protein
VNDDAMTGTDDADVVNPDVLDDDGDTLDDVDGIDNSDDDASVAGDGLAESLDSPDGPFSFADLFAALWNLLLGWWRQGM